MKDELIASTKLLEILLEKEISLVNKLDIIIQADKNLRILKKEMKEAEYDEEFSDFEEKVTRRLQKITDPSFIQKLLDVLRNADIKL